MSILQIIFLALVQGAAELLPVSSSAHVIVAEKLMGLDPSAPDMTFFLVMLHTGTMFAVMAYFGRRWLGLFSGKFLKALVLATACTGVVGLGLKKAIEKIFLAGMGGDSASVATHPELANTVAQSHGEIEHLFRNLPLVAAALFAAGCLILLSSRHEGRSEDKPATAPGSTDITARRAGLIGVIQGLCLPFRGFSRSGATISTGMIVGIDRRLSEEFSFALAVILTPPVILLELHRLHKATGSYEPSTFTPGLLGMVFAFLAGLGALKWLSSWLENGRWHYFGYYCLVFAGAVGILAAAGY